eukprot:scaffold258140_cov30-Prasinocladus_malaysianus.AAC.1
MLASDSFARELHHLFEDLPSSFIMPETLLLVLVGLSDEEYEPPRECLLPVLSLLLLEGARLGPEGLLGLFVARQLVLLLEELAAGVVRPVAQHAQEDVRVGGEVLPGVERHRQLRVVQMIRRLPLPSNNGKATEKGSRPRLAHMLVMPTHHFQIIFDSWCYNYTYIS